MRIKSIILIGLLLIASAGSSAQQWQWAKSNGSLNNDAAISVSTDYAGNVFVAGIFRDSIFSGANKLYSYGLDDIYIVKYNPNGSILWTKRFGGAGNDGYGLYIKADSMGNSFITGAYSYSAQFDLITLNSGYVNNMFLVMLNPTGSIVFANDFQGTNSSVGYALEVDRNQNCYLTGYFYNQLFAFPNTVYSNGSHDIFLAKIDGSGNVLWSKRAGGSSYDAGGGVALDDFGNVYITGYFSSTSDFDTVVLNSSGGDDVFVVKYDSSGNFNWISRTFGSGIYDIGVKIRIQQDKICVVGQFEDTMSIGQQTLTSYGGMDGFISLMDSAGNFLWTKQLGSPGNDRFSDAAFVANNEIVASAWINQTAFLDNTLINVFNKSGVVSWFDYNGNVISYKQSSNMAKNSFNALCTNVSNEILVAGAMEDTLQLDSIKLTSFGLADMIIGKIVKRETAVNEVQDIEFLVQNSLFSDETLPSIVFSEQVQIKSIELFDMIGNSVVKYFPQRNLDDGNRFTINNPIMSLLSRGIYFVRITTGISDKIVLIKIMKV